MDLSLDEVSEAVRGKTVVQYKIDKALKDEIKSIQNEYKTKIPIDFAKQDYDFYQKMCDEWIQENCKTSPWPHPKNHQNYCVWICLIALSLDDLYNIEEDFKGFGLHDFFNIAYRGSNEGGDHCCCGHGIFEVYDVEARKTGIRFTMGCDCIEKHGVTTLEKLKKEKAKKNLRIKERDYKKCITCKKLNIKKTKEDEECTTCKKKSTRICKDCEKPYWSPYKKPTISRCCSRCKERNEIWNQKPKKIYNLEKSIDYELVGFKFYQTRWGWRSSLRTDKGIIIEGNEKLTKRISNILELTERDYHKYTNKECNLLKSCRKYNLILNVGDLEWWGDNNEKCYKDPKIKLINK